MLNGFLISNNEIILYVKPLVKKNNNIICLQKKNIIFNYDILHFMHDILI